MPKFTSLQQRLSILLLLPVTLLLIGMGTFGFFYARNSLLAQWTEATTLKLQRAAHHVDMRLSRPKELIRLFLEISDKSTFPSIREAVLNQIRSLEGVERVNLDLDSSLSEQGWWTSRWNQTNPAQEWQGHMEDMMGRRDRIATVTPPRYDPAVNGETVSLLSFLKAETGETVGRLEVVIRFDYLVDAVVESGWWQDHEALLVDSTGRVLSSNISLEQGFLQKNTAPLETATLNALREEEFGTVLGPGHPPNRISGFYRLQEAPWYLLIIAPGREIFKPIAHFRNIYLIIGAAFILVILFLIRWVTGRTVSDIRGVSQTACRIAGGEHQDLLPVTSRDEVGELIGSFNTMLVKLEERDRLKSAIHLAMEVQQNLLPDNSMRLKHLDIVGKSIYCDETGGDYYDFIPLSDSKEGPIGIAVGDVAGHGISAALLMTTVRALLRCRVTQPGSISEIMTDINRLLCLDTGDSGNFMTLFLMVVDSEKGEIRWVRAGHDPALIYNPDTDAFIELTGEGFVLGVDDDWKFEEYAYPAWKENQMALIGTDGIWETENPHGEPYGKERLQNLIRSHHSDTPAQVMRALIYDLAAFRGDAKQEDDVTMVIIKGRS